MLVLNHQRLHKVRMNVNVTPLVSTFNLVLTYLRLAITIFSLWNVSSAKSSNLYFLKLFFRTISLHVDSISFPVAELTQLQSGKVNWNIIDTLEIIKTYQSLSSKR